MRALVAVAVLVVLVAGVPWGLWHHIGWPLPTRVPTLSEVGVVLLGPMHSTLLLNVLACVCWVVWAAFSVDVARCTRDAVHDLRRPGARAVRASRSPTHAVAAVLVGAIALSVLGQRAAAHLHAGPPPGEHAGTPAVAAAPTWHAAPPHPISYPVHAGLRPVGYVVGPAHDVIGPHLGLHDRGQGEPAVPDSVVVRAPDPRTGTHDSLWRIAERTLGDGARWPEIFELNEGKPQPNGGTLVRPSLIFPGEELRLPDPGPDPAPGDRPPSLLTPVPELPATADPMPPDSEVPAVPDRTDIPDDAAPPDQGDDLPEVPVPVDPGIAFGPEMYVGIGLASAISAALLVARQRHRRRYRPGSGRRDDLPVAPVIYQLRLSHLRTGQDPDDAADRDTPVHDAWPAGTTALDRDDADCDDAGLGEADFGVADLGDADVDHAHSDDADGDAESDDTDSDDAEFGDAEFGDGADLHDDIDEPGPARRGFGQNSSSRARASAGTPVVGTRGGRGLALDLAGARGLGLVGPGAAASARALLIDVLADRQGTDVAGRVVVPAGELAALLGPAGSTTTLPAALQVTETLDDALDELDELILARTEHHDTDHHGTDHDDIDHQAADHQAADHQATNHSDRAVHLHPVVVLVARPAQHQRARLQSILDNRSSVGIVGILLGQWQPGVTAYVGEDGTVSATGPGAGEALRGVRLFHLGETETSQLLTLLHRSQPEPVEPASPDPVSSHPDPDPDPDGLIAKPVASDSADPPYAGPEDAAPVDDEPERVDDKPAHGAASDLRSGSVTDGPPQPHPTGPTASSAVATPTPEGKDPSAPRAGGNGPSRLGRASVRVTVLGRPRVHWWTTPIPDGASPEGEREMTAAFQPRTRELLTFLAVHPAGVRREELVDNLWPHSPPERKTSALNSALTRLRRTLTDATEGAVVDIVDAADGRIRLDPTVVEVDFWEFEDAVAARRAATTTGQRHDAHHRIVNAYGGTLAEDLTAAWIEPAREAVRRTALDAVVALARDVHEADPQKALDLLETARAFDPYNEAIYRNLIRMQAALGLLDAIPRTLALLTTRLAESGDQPDPDTVALAERAAQPPHRRADTSPASPRPNRSPQPSPPDLGRRRAG